MTTWNALVPELVVTDLDRSLAFYRAAGFVTRFARTDPPFAYLDRGAAQLMLEEQHADQWETAPLEPPFGRGMNLQVEVEVVDEVARTLVEAGHPVLRPAVDTWYAVGPGEEEGQREVLVRDPDGYLLRFSQPLGTRVR